MNDASRDHLGDDVELHVLGLLAPAESARVESHAAACLPCLQRLGEAEAAVAALGSTLPALTPPPSLGARLTASAARGAETRPRPSARRRWAERAFVPLAALAAALALAFGLTLGALVQIRQSTPPLDAVALATIVHGHFSHASMLVAPGAEPLAAKVLYARSGAWIVVLVDHPVTGLTAFATVAGREIPCGPVRTSAGVGSAFARLPARAERVELRAGERTVATATLVYPKS